MPAHLLNGTACAESVLQHIRASLSAHHLRPGLAVVLVGHNAASQTYVRRKRSVCEELGFCSLGYDLPETTTTEQLLELIDELNHRPDVHGILIQLPLPPSIDSNLIIMAINPTKDVDGFHPLNMGLLALNQPRFKPCTPFGIMTLLKHHHISVTGLHALVIGASRIVGRPMALELLNAGSTVTIAHSKTHDLESLMAEADVVVAAIGKPGVLPSSALKQGVIAVDVGFTRQPDGTLLGDLDAGICHERAAWYTPVPGGVGPMTIAMLMSNTLKAASDVFLKL